MPLLGKIISREKLQAYDKRLFSVRSLMLNYGFKTTRLGFQPITYQDKNFYCHLLTNETVMEFDGGAVNQVEAEKAFNNALRATQSFVNGNGQYILFAITDKISQKTIGFIVLYWRKQQLINIINEAQHIINILPQDNEPEIGIFLLDKVFNQGFATEAFQGLIDWALQHFTINKFHYFYHPENRASVKVAKKLDFTQTGMVKLDLKLKHFYKYVQTQ